MTYDVPIARPVIGREEIKAVKKVLESGMLVQGERVFDFGSRFSEYVGTKYGVPTSSGTTALMSGLKSLGIKKGDEVITSPFTFIASSNSILFQGARPVFADIDKETFNIDPGLIEEKITRRTKALLIVHLYGNPCEMDSILRICREHNLLLIEDCAQAAGAEYRGKRVGSFGDLSIFSFYPTKNMTTAEGGMILTDKEDVARKASIIINQGQEGQYEHKILGYNYRMNEMQAALGLIQLKKLDVMNQKRTENALFLTKGLSGLEWIETPAPTPRSRHVFHQYTIKVAGNRRDELLKYLSENGIETRIYYPRPVYLQPAYQKIGLGGFSCPVSEDICRHILSVPVHPSLKKHELELIVKKVRSF
jgi:perosamine synthetase